jgi:hypothetical protein
MLKVKDIFSCNESAEQKKYFFAHNWIYNFHSLHPVVYCKIELKNRQHNTNSQSQIHSSGYISYIKNNMFRLFQSSSGFFT